MNKKNSPSVGHNKKSFLNKPVEHIDITKFDARELVNSMGKMSFHLKRYSECFKNF